MVLWKHRRALEGQGEWLKKSSSGRVLGLLKEVKVAK
jgi:hypothetical protein